MKTWIWVVQINKNRAFAIEDHPTYLFWIKMTLIEIKNLCILSDELGESANKKEITQLINLIPKLVEVARCAQLIISDFTIYGHTTNAAVLKTALDEL